MKTAVRQIASLVIGLTGIVLFAIGLNRVLDIGSCASGGSYVVARPCPEGTTAVFWMLMAGVFLWIVGIILSPGAFMEPGAGQILWTVGFAGGGIVLLIKVLTQPMLSDAKLGATIVAVLFIPMGLAVGIVGIVQLVRKRATSSDSDRAKRDARAAQMRRLGAATDTWPRLKALNELRSTGSLTREEFDALKADLADAEPHDPGTPATDRIARIRQLTEQRKAGDLSAEEFKAGKRSVLLGLRVEAPKR